MKYFIYLFSLIILCSCSKPEENFIKIPSQFSVSVQEEIRSQSPTRGLVLELKSMKASYCAEDSLIHSSSYSGDLLTVSISETYKEYDCIQAAYYLKSRIPIPEFQDSIHIQIQLGASAVVNCTIFNYPTYYSIQINNGTGLVNTYEKTYKIPYNMIWGYVYPKSLNEDGQLLMNSFLRDIEFDCSAGRLQQGYYSYFSIVDKDVLVLNENLSIAGIYQNFYHPHEKSEEDLIKLFNSLASKYVNLVGYKINTGSGLEFKSN